MLFSVAVGFHYGQQIELPHPQVLTTSELAADKSEARSPLGIEASSLSLDFPKLILLEASYSESSQETAQDGKHAQSSSQLHSSKNETDNREYLIEIEYLTSRSSKLRKRVAALEWETLTLESDLLASEVELGKALADLKKIEGQRRSVYNITNVPVGGYVVPAPGIQNESVAPAQQPEILTAPQPKPAISQVIVSQQSSAEPVEQAQPARQTTFFGPAPDRYEDLVNPAFAETPQQSQNTMN
ncbi:MAG: hypothetical protein AB8B79_21365 [Granulosicoccus sp.]